MSKTSSLKTKSVVHPDGTPGVITYGLHYLPGNADAYFTVTAWFGGSRTGWGGACHEDILACAPELKPLVDLHLSAEDGWPMHLYANAASHCGIGKWTKFAPRWLASHLRISDEAADMLANNADIAELRAFITSQLPRYEAEARAAIEKFNLR